LAGWSARWRFLPGQATPPPRLELGQRAVSAATGSGQTNREIWRWLALLGLAVLCVEWFVYHRRL